MIEYINKIRYFFFYYYYFCHYLEFCGVEMRVLGMVLDRQSVWLREAKNAQGGGGGVA